MKAPRFFSFVILLISFLLTACSSDEKAQVPAESSAAESTAAEPSSVESSDVESSGVQSSVISTNKRLEKSSGLSVLPTCVETSLPLNRCFSSVEDYGKWKQCVKQNGDRVKCYIVQYPTASKPRPELPENPDEGDIDFAGQPGPYPEGNHFQFNYIVRELTGDDIQYLQDWGDITRLVDRQGCLFVGDVESTLHDEMDIDVSVGYTAADGVYDVDYDVRGDSPDCQSDKATRFWMNFLQLRPINRWLYPVFNPLQIPNVRVGNDNYVLDDEDMFIRLRWENYQGGVASGRFEFIAALADNNGVIIDNGDTNTYVVGYYGHFSLQEGQ